MKLLDCQANETNAREMNDILNATLEKQKEHDTQVSDNSEKLYIAHQKFNKAEADNAALNNRLLEAQKAFKATNTSLIDHKGTPSPGPGTSVDVCG